MAEVFANPLAELAEYTDMKQDMDKGKGPIQVSGVTDSQKFMSCMNSRRNIRGALS